MPKCKLSEIKKVGFLNNQIKFYTQTSEGQLYYSTFQKSIKYIYDLCYDITLRQCQHRSQDYHYHFLHCNNQHINTFLYKRLVQLVLHLHMHSSITDSGAGRFFVMIDSYDFSGEFHLQPNSLGSSKTGDGKSPVVQCDMSIFSRSIIFVGGSFSDSY